MPEAAPLESIDEPVLPHHDDRPVPECQEHPLHVGRDFVPLAERHLDLGPRLRFRVDPGALVSEEVRAPMRRSRNASSESFSSRSGGLK